MPSKPETRPPVTARHAPPPCCAPPRPRAQGSPFRRARSRTCWPRPSSSSPPSTRPRSSPLGGPASDGTALRGPAATPPSTVPAPLGPGGDRVRDRRPRPHRRHAHRRDPPAVQASARRPVAASSILLQVHSSAGSSGRPHLLATSFKFNGSILGRVLSDGRLLSSAGFRPGRDLDALIPKTLRGADQSARGPGGVAVRSRRRCPPPGFLPVELARLEGVAGPVLVLLLGCPLLRRPVGLGRDPADGRYPRRRPPARRGARHRATLALPSATRGAAAPDRAVQAARRSSSILCKWRPGQEAAAAAAMLASPSLTSSSRRTSGTRPGGTH